MFEAWLLERWIAIVCEGDRVLGVFTTVDALRALHRQLEQR
jgi:hypothetical protein